MQQAFEPIPKKSRIIKTDKPRPFLCPICTRGFVRQEHLRRHQRSHTRERPFWCLLCGRCFARKDLVIRHQQKLHAPAIDNNNFEKNIVKVIGNKETILPTSLNSNSQNIANINQQKDPIIQHLPINIQNQQELPKQHLSIPQVPVQSSNLYIEPPILPQKRHASFSAATSFSYVPTTTEETLQNIPESENIVSVDGPHQVGFSTPQFTSQQIVDKAIQSGLLEIDPLELPPNASINDFGTQLSLSNFDAFKKSQSEPIRNINNMFSGSTAFLASLPSLADMLTLSSFSTGVGGYSKIGSSSKLNFNPFDYSSELLNLKNIPTTNSTNTETPSDSVPVNSVDTDPWLSEFLDEKFLPMDSDLNNVGFFDNLRTPTSNNQRKDSLSDKISGLFTSRQLDIYNNNNNGIKDGPLTFNFSSVLKPEIKVIDQSNEANLDSLNYFDESLRKFIISDNGLKLTNFPTIAELNSYVKLYNTQFSEYYPFIHLYSIIPSRDNYPLLLSIAMIGALYSFHSTHSKLLSIICNVQIKKILLKNEPLVSLSVIQSLVLLSFFNIFNNNVHMTKQMAPQLTTLLNLIKSGKLNLPLELSVQPPVPNDQFMKYQHNPDEIKLLNNLLNSSEQVKKNFDYFILAQQRIRVCHMVHLLSSLYAAMIGVQYSLHSVELKCGLPTYYEELYECKNHDEWSGLLRNKYRIAIDSKFSLIQLSNGGESYESYLMYLSDGYNDNNKLLQKKVSRFVLLSLVISIHEKISFERRRAKDMNLNWKTNSRTTIDSMIRAWEVLYLKNGGTFVTNEDSLRIFDNDSMSRLIVPMYYFAKIRLCVDFSQVLSKIWVKDWSSMNELLQKITKDQEYFQEAMEVGLSVIESWINVVASIKSIPNEKRKTYSYKTPIFTITCIFESILIISEYLKHIEDWVANQKDNLKTIELSQFDEIFYFKAANVMKRLQDILLPRDKDEIKSSYIEFLKLQTVENFDLDGLLLTPPSLGTDSMATLELIQTLNLSSKVLYLGVKILSDAPIWPIALLFAHALQSRAIYNVSNGLIDM